MYTNRTHIREFVVPAVSTGMKLYIRHRPTCKHRQNREYNRCGCPVWYQHDRKRWSAGTNNWDEAMRSAANLEPTPVVTKFLTITKAVEMYLIKRSGKVKNAEGAPYRDRWLLRDGGKRQPSLLQWADGMGFTKLGDITSLDVDRWRQTWVFREESSGLKISNGAIKAFFTWATRFDLLAKNPFLALDKLKLTPLPTLPLDQEEYAKLLACAEAGKRGETIGLLVLLMRWSGLAIHDACALRRAALTAANTIKTHRQKTGEYVYVGIPASVAMRLRAHNNIHPDFFFWNGRSKPAAHAASRGNLIRAAYNKAGITPRGCHRLRDSFAVEFLNAGGLLQDLSMLLGHSSIRTTERSYVPWVKSRQQKLDAAMAANLAAQGVGEASAQSEATIQ